MPSQDGQRQGHRRRARSRAHHRVLDAVAHPLVHERGAEGGLEILGSGRHRAPIRAHAVCQDPRHAPARRAPRPRTAARAGARVHPDLPVLGPGGRRARRRPRADLRRRTRPRAIRHERRQPGGRRPTHRRAGWRGHLPRLLDGRALRAARRPRPRRSWSGGSCSSAARRGSRTPPSERPDRTRTAAPPRGSKPTAWSSSWTTGSDSRCSPGCRPNGPSGASACGTPSRACGRASSRPAPARRPRRGSSSATSRCPCS